MNLLKKQQNQMLNTRLKSFKYAFKGMADLLKSQPNARIHLFLTILSVSAGVYFQLPSLEWYIIIICIGLVFAAEAFNTALEYLTDLVSPEYNELAGKAKDAAAAGVLFVAIAAFIIGFCIFVPRIYTLLL